MAPAAAAAPAAPARDASAVSGRAAVVAPAQPPRLRSQADLTPDQQVAQVTVDVAAQVASVRHAQEAGQVERLSINAQPGVFDRAAYVRDPAAYLNVFVPCRIWQQGDPATSAPLQTPSGQTAALVTVASSTQQDLQVRTWPGYPATFTSYDRGAFANGLPSITVQADAQGIATATFTATPGTVDRVRLACASPVMSGQVTFIVVIPVPGSP